MVRLLKLFLLGAVLVFVMFCSLHVHGTLHSIGVEPRTPSTTYNFWSGFGSDIGEYTVAFGILAGLGGLYKKHNCREDKCLRIGWHEYLDEHGQSHPACHIHHPHMGKGHVFHFHVLHAAKLAKEQGNGSGQ